MQSKIKQLAISGIIAALYLAITLTPGINTISYGPVQFRIAEALTVLAFIFPGAIFGLFAGCLLANLFGGIGIHDVVFGSLCTLIAAWTTYQLRKTNLPILAPLPPIIINAFGVSAYLHYFFDIPYWILVGQIGFGQAVVCYVLGYPLLLMIIKRQNRFN
ncbi:MAG: QueT transporter family protein [candidate division Zixibacteria bacterium]|nr:QueT transporter family protein [candidate division Zixibacteria bacterium]